MTNEKMKALTSGRICKARDFEAQGRYDLAIQALEEAVTADPCSEEVHLLLGTWYHRKADYESALRELGRVRELNPDNDDVLLMTGNVYFGMGRHDLAEEYFKRSAMSEATNRSQAHIELGRLAEMRKDYGTAAAEYEKALALGFNADLALKVIRWQNFVGNRERAIELAEAHGRHIAVADEFTRNMVLNEREIAEQKLVLASRPRSFTITLTNRCNLDCIMCEAKHIDWDMPERVLREITESFPYLEHIMWQGGEVFLLDGFTDILREAKKYPRMKQVITSNGMALSREAITELAAQSDLTLTLSIDAAEKALFEKIRKGASWETLLENIALLNEARQAAGPGMKLNINVTVMRSNYRQLGGIIEFARKHRFDFVFFTTVTGNEGTGENIFRDRDPEALAYLAKEIPEIERKAREYGIFLHNWLPRPSTSEPESEKPSVDTQGACQPSTVTDRNPGLLCHAPWQRIYIDWKGNFFPDCMCLPDQPAGNVKEASLIDLWNGEGMQRYRRKVLAGDYHDLCKKDCIERRIPPEYLKFNR